MLGVIILFAVPCAMFASSSDHELWRVSVPGACFALIWIASWKAWRKRAGKRAIALERDADAKAELLCGSQVTLSALECMVTQGFIDAARFHALQDRFR
ncbi:hypothetical protein P9239_20585 [Caballeronia sp. LZ062]|uniref:hypothetical protein n=1 Tax=Caballeronia sp. LZ062 TaxID=3038557 RepID=UPI00285D40E2|nr:hypothetical protein [Caballeronia sp. LZ062]MDR5872744.1 hypothetical protein [Caballeronia sp. LZ062]